MKSVIGFFACMLTLACVGIALHAGPGVSQTPEAQRFVPGELLIGYKTTGDRDKAVANLSERKGDLTAMGTQTESLSVTVERLRGNEIKLTLDFAPATSEDLLPEEQLGLLMETAQQLRASDDTIVYAHPNWITTFDPMPSAPLDDPPSEIELNGSGPAPPAPLDDSSQELELKKSSGAKPSGRTPNDWAFHRGLQWHYLPPPKGMNAVGAWQHTKGSRDIVVAVLDSGILFNHPDFAGSNILSGYDFVSKSEDARDGDGRDADPTDLGDWCLEKGREKRRNSWHGTHVAGTIGATTNNKRAVAGVNWQVSVLPVRILGKCGDATLLDIADGIRWAAGLSMGGLPKNPTPADIINLSIGFPIPCVPQKVGYLIDAIEAAQKAGAVLVVAAGNENTNIRGSSPASCPGVISVAASGPTGKLAFYSNFGNTTIMAPGGDLRRGARGGVWSLFPIMTKTTKRDVKNSSGALPLQGTSMAAPHVSAAIALALENNPNFRKHPKFVEHILRKTAAKLKRGQCPKSRPCGPGQLDALKLVTYEPTVGEAMWLDCESENVDRRIRGCTWLIDADKVDPKLVNAYFNRGEAHAHRGKHELAIADLTKAIEIDPGNAWAYIARGLSYYKTDAYDPAIADFTKAIEIAPYLIAYFHRGNAHLLKADYDLAINDYTTVIENSPNFISAYKNRGIAYEKKGENDKAIADYRKVLKIDPSNEFAKERLARLELLAGLEGPLEKKPTPEMSLTLSEIEIPATTASLPELSAVPEELLLTAPSSTMQESGAR